MDFASMMAAQIAKTQSKGGSGAPRQKSRREEEEAREKAYREEQARAQAERQAKAEKKRKAMEDERDREAERLAKKQRIAEDIRRAKEAEEEEEEKKRRKRLGLPELRKKEEQELLDDGDDDGEEVTEEALETWLERAGEPLRLDNETVEKRRLRYRRLKQKATRILTLEKSRENLDPIPTYLEPVPEIDCKIADSLPSVEEKEKRKFLARQITTWFNIILREWRIALAKRDEAVKKTMTGMQAAQSRDIAINDLKPLFRKLEKLTTEPKDLPDDLLRPIANIVRAAQERRYVNANDEYLQVSIGKAAWPIGVTMVGIHERSAREKLHESDNDKAHIMADESTRKFLQSIKRCLSFAQTRWPPEDVGQLMG